ncbi:MAG: 50S ribosomal protein L3 [Candidatus Vogelbacteria bacterium RIFOXYD2_FULL_44_9]|uniref:50S ribosomal protein L3 n=1 Tax=Candidatus Vogelbacteria bacterium RIFOXYD2_FULL_44_9 TaxID=1802441 RepID=A0A1G2QKC0_9BACT|nr:MAG: 50S ribosomal protein L3 [Candidatus Vogelbacteria bacterium RIFOXYD2_FULL_44_9]
MKFILGTKQRMTQVFDDNGRSLIGTVISVAPSIVTQIKTAGQGNQSSVQIGYGEKRAKNAGKPMLGHIAPALKAADKENISFQYLREFTTDTAADYKIGDTVDSSIFTEGEEVTVIGTSKGKGFQGVVKRHGFHGGPRSHGQKHSEREAGSIGVGGVQRVFKGMRMAGRMGSDRVTTKYVKILKINKEAKEILIQGAVPGRPGSLIQIIAK